MAIQIRRGSNAEWEVNNSNIVVGEPAVATDSKRAFIGTASGAYMELANLEAIAPAYDPGNSYMIDDYVSYQGKLYVCTVPTGGVWNASCWQVTSIGQALAENAYSNYETYTMSGGIVSFPNGAGGIPVKDLTAVIEAVQSGSGDPSPTNVRPISGWDEVNVNVYGKNFCVPLLDNSASGITITANQDGSVRVDGTATAEVLSGGGTSSTRLAVFPLLKQGTYILSGNNGLRFYCSARNKDGTNAYVTNTGGTSLANFTLSTNIDSYTFTVNKPCCVVVRIDVLNGETTNKTCYPMIRLASDTDDAYEPYNGQTYTINLNGTRYGGTLDVTTGVLTIDKAEVDLGTLNWVANGTYANTFNGTSLNPYAKVASVGTNWICSQYKAYDSSAVGTVDAGISISTNRFTVYVRDIRYNDPATFKTAMSGVQLVYELATPQVVQLTPTQVRTLLGQNNIWADSGEVEVTYRISNVQ